MGTLRLLTLVLAFGLMAFHLDEPPKAQMFKSDLPMSFTADMPQGKLVGVNTPFQKRDPYQFSDINTDFILIDLHHNIVNTGVRVLAFDDSACEFLYSFYRAKDFFLFIYSKLTFL